MEIKIKYSVSDKKHSFIMNTQQINNLSVTANGLTLSQNTRQNQDTGQMNYKELFINGTKEELESLSNKIKALVQTKK